MPSNNPSKSDSSDEEEEVTVVSTQEAKTPDVDSSDEEQQQEEKPKLPPKRKRKKKEVSETSPEEESNTKTVATIEKKNDSVDPEIKAKEESSKNESSKENNDDSTSKKETKETKETKKKVKSGISRRIARSIFACSNPWMAKSAKVDIREHRIFFAHTHLNCCFKSMGCCCCKCCHEAKVTDSAVHTFFIEFPYLIHEQLDFNYVYDISLEQPWYSCCCCGIGKIDLMTGTARERTKENHQTVTIDCIPRSRNVFDELSKFLTEGNFRQFRVAAKMNVGTAIG